VCRHYLSNGQSRTILAGRRRQEYPGPLDVRAPDGDRNPARAAGGQMDRCGDGRTWRPARRHPRIAAASSTSRTSPRRRDLPQPATASRADAGIYDFPSIVQVPMGSPEAVRRLFAMAKPIAGTLVEFYLRHRAYHLSRRTAALRFHPRCYYKPGVMRPTETWPAMIAAVTDLKGHITGAHRTWLDPSGRDKAPVDTPRRAMGHLLGHAVRFGVADDVMAAGEGIETMLSLRCVMPDHADERRRFRPRISPPSCSRPRCAGSISSATTIRPATARRRT
jgi:hypothetical protein